MRSARRERSFDGRNVAAAVGVGVAVVDCRCRPWGRGHVQGSRFRGLCPQQPRRTAHFCRFPRCRRRVSLVGLSGALRILVFFVVGAGVWRRRREQGDRRAAARPGGLDVGGASGEFGCSIVSYRSSRFERAIGERKGDCETFDSISDQRKKTCSVFPLVAAVARPPRDVLSYLLFLLNLLLKPRKKTKKCNSLSLSLSLQAGIDWTKLRDLLASGDFRAADDEHRARLIELAGPAAVERNWVYFSEVKTMPARDLRVMDALWRGASNGKYGFSAQREVWLTNRKR